MFTRVERNFVAAGLAGLVFSGVSMFLILQAAVDRMTDGFSLFFWISLAWAVILGALLFIRTRRKGLWSGFADAEASLRQRFGLSAVPARGRLDSRWFAVFLAASVVAYLLLAGASGWGFLYFSE